MSDADDMLDFDDADFTSSSGLSSEGSEDERPPCLKCGKTSCLGAGDFSHEPKRPEHLVAPAAHPRDSAAVTEAKAHLRDIIDREFEDFAASAEWDICSQSWKTSKRQRTDR